MAPRPMMPRPMMSSNIDRSTAPSTQLRRQWDPGIAKDGINRSFYMPTSHSNVVVIDRSFYQSHHDCTVGRLATLMVFPLIAMIHGLRPSPMTWLRNTDNADTPIPSMHFRFPAQETTMSLFHYSHPVLSRPTVPNIQ